MGQRRRAKRSDSAGFVRGHNHHVRRLDCPAKLDQRQHAAAGPGEHQLRRVRNRKRGLGQCGVQLRPISKRCRRAFPFSFRRATAGRQAATTTLRKQLTALASTPLRPRRITWPWAARTSATRTPAQTAVYWSSTNTATFGSALSYIPEIPWNDSCAGRAALELRRLRAHPTARMAFATTTLAGIVLTTIAGGGGPSACATGSPSVAGVVSGTCAGLAEAFVAVCRSAILAIPMTACGILRTFPCSPRTALEPLLRLLLVRHGKWRGSLHRRSEQLVRCGRNLVCLAHHGRHPGPRKSKDGSDARAIPIPCTISSPPPSTT